MKLHETVCRAEDYDLSGKVQRYWFSWDNQDVVLNTVFGMALYQPPSIDLPRWEIEGQLTRVQREAT